MQKKNWSKPEILNIGLEQTQGGGKKPVTHDGVMYEITNPTTGDKEPVEAYWS